MHVNSFKFQGFFYFSNVFFKTKPPDLNTTCFNQSHFQLSLEVAPSQDQLVAPKIAMCVKRIPHKVRFGGLVRSSFWLVSI